ncbi:hypothetical protein PAMA_006291 [Pampus argenteus]
MNAGTRTTLASQEEQEQEQEVDVMCGCDSLVNENLTWQLWAPTSERRWLLELRTISSPICCREEECNSAAERHHLPGVRTTTRRDKNGTAQRDVT